MGLTVAQSGGNGNSVNRKARTLRRAALIGGASALALTIAAPAFAPLCAFHHDTPCSPVLVRQSL